MADSVKIKLTGDDKEFRSTLSGVGQTANSVFKGLMASQIVTKGISMLANGLKSAINTGMQFEAAMSQVAAISGATGAELELLTETAKRYGETTMFSASQAAEALNYMALAGWDAQQSVDALGGVLDLAAASGMDLGAASDAVTDYLSAFGMEASQAGYMADLMAYAQSRSNTTANMLADAYGNCASSMHAAGQDIETTTAMLMALANQGIKGSEAGTQMSAVMRDLTQKMDHGQIMIGKTAVKVTDAAGNFRDLNDILVDVGKATEGMGTAEQSAAIMETFTARSVKAIQTILNEGVQNVNDYEAALRGSEGTAAEQAEKMMDNLQGDIKIFQSALEGVQITASETMNGTARSIVQEGTAVLDAINQAGKTDGLAGMADAAIAQIPSLLPKVVSGVERLLKGVGGRLPGLMKGLFASLPDLLGAGGELVPTLIESLTDAGGAAIEGLIGNLPNMLPVLFAGIGKGILGAGNGVLNLVESVFTGVDQAFLQAGMRKMRLDEVIQSQLDNVDAERVKKLTGNIEADYKFDPVTIDVEAYSEALETAIDTIREAIDGVADLDNGSKAKLKAAILSGSGAEAVTEALTALNIPQETIDQVTESVSTAFSSIQGALSGLNLNDEQIQSILDSLAKGEDIEQALIDFGVDPGTAEQTAQDLTDSMNTLNEGLTGVDVDSSQVVSFFREATVDKALIALALGALKIPADTVADVADSYDTLNETLTARITGAFELLKSSLTNGIPDSNDPAFAEAKQKVADFFEQAYSVIDEWEEGKKQELEESGLSESELQTKLQEIEAEAQSMRDQIGELASTTNDWVEANAGAAGSVVKQHFDELEEMIEQVYGIDAKIEALKGSMSQGGQVNRRGVEQGLITDQQGQLEAINYTSQELDHALQQANDKASRALEEAGEQFGNDTEGYAKRRAEIMDTLASEEGAAYDTYDDHMQKIVDSMIANSPELAEAVEKYGQDQQLADAGHKMFEGIQNAVNEAAKDPLVDPQTWFANNVNLSDADYAAMAGKLGIEPEQLKQSVKNALTGDGTDPLLTSDDFRAMLDPGQGLAEALEGLDLSSVNEVLTAALNENLLTDGGDIDWTNLGDVLKTGISDVAGNIPAGLVEGMTDTTGVAAAGTALGQAGVDGVAAGAQTQSPSAATRETGQNVVAGLVEGMGETGSVTAAGNALGQAAVNSTQASTKGSGNIGLQFAHGLAFGILAGRSNVIAAAISVANAAAQAARAALQINSPSRVTRALGEGFDEGFVVGIDREAGSVVRSAVNLVNNVVGAANLAPKMDLSGMQSALSGAMTDFTDAEAERDIVLRLNGRDLARVTATDNNKALNHYSKQVALGYGRG